MFSKVFALTVLVAYASGCSTGICQQNAIYPNELSIQSLPLSGLQQSSIFPNQLLAVQSAPAAYQTVSIAAPAPVALPAPSVVSDSCACSRKVLRNQIFQQTLQVPAVRQEVRNYVNNILQTERYSRPGQSAGSVIASGSADLYAPVSVDGLVNAGSLAGYGTGAVGVLGGVDSIADCGAGLALSGNVEYAPAAPLALNNAVLEVSAPALAPVQLSSEGYYGNQATLPISASAPVLVSTGPGRVISDNCDCTRITSRPQLRQTVVNVPSIKTITRSFNSPRIETVQYNSGSGSASALAPASLDLGYGIASLGLGNGVASSDLGYGVAQNGLFDCSTGPLPVYSAGTTCN